jgi:hypothetical protein
VLNSSPRKPLRNRLTAPDADNNGIPDSTTAGYTYDSNGSQITVTQSGSTTYYLWDLRNRMVGISLDNDGNATDPGETTYGYDSNAVRVSQITYGSPNSAIVYLNDANNPTGYTKALEKKTGTSVSAAASSTPTTTYVLGLRVEGQKDSTSTVWFERDGHGSNRGLTESNGTVSASYDYNAFGDPIGFTPATARTTELFGGDGVYDPATAWTYHLARWRNGFRFTSFDSYEGDSEDPQSLHKYLYTSANPIMGIDPTGRAQVEINGQIWKTPIVNDLSHVHAISEQQRVALRLSPGTRDLGPHLHGPGGAKFFPNTGVIKYPDGRVERAPNSFMKKWQQQRPQVAKSLARAGITGALLIVGLLYNEYSGENDRMVSQIFSLLPKLRGHGMAQNLFAAAIITQNVQALFGSDIAGYKLLPYLLNAESGNPFSEQSILDKLAVSDDDIDNSLSARCMGPIRGLL